MDITKLKEIARLRKEADELNARKGELNYKLSQSPEGVELGEVASKIKLVKAQLSTLEPEYKEECEAIYLMDEDANKPGGKIGLYGGGEKKEYNYKHEDAIQWAIEGNHPNVILLNAETFEPAAEALGLEFVEITIVNEPKEPKMRLDKDVSEFLEI
jgi:hypothetical protein